MPGTGGGSRQATRAVIALQQAAEWAVRFEPANHHSVNAAVDVFEWGDARHGGAQWLLIERAQLLRCPRGQRQAATRNTANPIPINPRARNQSEDSDPQVFVRQYRGLGQTGR
ncbi:hypothetical protein [Nitrospira sp. CMX1]